VQQLVFQVNPTHALVVIQHWNGFDCFFASNCNSPGVMTVILGNHSDNFFCRSTLWQKTGPESCAIISPFFFFQFRVFNFFKHFFGSVSVCRHSRSCVQSSIFWLDRVSYRNYPSTQSGPVSIEAPPVSKQWLLFCWCQLLWLRGSCVLCPCLHIQERTISTQWQHHTAHKSWFQI
jgi:hypothetical protein